MTDADYDAQQEELEVLQSIFYEQEIYSDTINPSFSLTLNLDDETHISNPLLLDVSFPSNYPSKSLPNIRLQCNDLTRQEISALYILTNQHMTTLSSEICMFSTIEFIKDKIVELVKQRVISISSSDSKTKSQVKSPPISRIQTPVAFVREVVWFHHIYSKHKKKVITHEAERLGVTGVWLMGRPGLMIAEGREANIDEYLANLRALNWQKMQSRHREYFRSPRITQECSKIETKSRQHTNSINNQNKHNNSHKFLNANESDTQHLISTREIIEMNDEFIHGQRKFAGFMSYEDRSSFMEVMRNQGLEHILRAVLGLGANSNNSKSNSNSFVLSSSSPSIALDSREQAPS